MERGWEAWETGMWLSPKPFNQANYEDATTQWYEQTVIPEFGGNGEGLKQFSTFLDAAWKYVTTKTVPTDRAAPAPRTRSVVTRKAPTPQTDASGGDGAGQSSGPERASEGIDVRGDGGGHRDEDHGKGTGGTEADTAIDVVEEGEDDVDVIGGPAKANGDVERNRGSGVEVNAGEREAKEDRVGTDGDGMGVANTRTVVERGKVGDVGGEKDIVVGHTGKDKALPVNVDRRRSGSTSSSLSSASSQEGMFGLIISPLNLVFISTTRFGVANRTVACTVDDREDGGA